MAHTVEQFAQSCRSPLKAEPGPAGRKKVCALLQDVLKDDAFIAATFSDSTPERHLLHEDPELGFCILAHNYKSAKESPPHDHGPSWAIYGQAKGETEMTDYELVERATPQTPGKARPVRTYKLKPGMAYRSEEHTSE